jgi:SagB-type dehydrogenase family enzyme
MNAKYRAFGCRILTALLVCSTAAFAEQGKVIPLGKPDMEGGKPLMQVLKERKSTRRYSDKQLSKQVLSNLLWAAWGINRPESGKRTAPSSVNRQEIDVYVATADGLYLYDAEAHALQLILEEDIRADTGTQGFVKTAPVNLVYVADLSKLGRRSDKNENLSGSAANTGFISQNVYLFCASEGLGTVVRGMVDKKALAEKMQLRPDQRIILGQSVGYPKE